MFRQTSKRSLRRRKPHGVTTIALITVLAIFVILPLTLFGFELARYILMQQQLQACVDAAALSGTAALASSPQGFTLPQQHTLAMNVAKQTFEQNSILQTPLNTGNVNSHNNVGWDTGSPPLYQAVLNIYLLNQNGQPEATGSQDAVVMRIEGRYTDKAIFASSLFPVGLLQSAVAVSDGGLPRLDLFLCFDVSGSIDDETEVVFVRRYWDGAQMQYANVRQGKIFAVCGPPPEGTGLNAPPPQNLSFPSYPWNGTTGNTIVTTFSESAYPPPSLIAGLRGRTATPPGALVPEQGWPPGNYDPGDPSNPNGNGINPSSYDPDGFTDMVVQVPDDGAFTFPNLATCVEASRGNLESAAMLSQAVPGPNPGLPAPQAGYYNAYWSQVRKVSQPIATARGAAINFFDTMNVSSNAHFGVVAFTDVAGTAPTSTYTPTPNGNVVDRDWPHGGALAYPLPKVDLDLTQNNLQEVKDAIDGTGGAPPIGPLRQTNIADALDKALDALEDTGKTRPQAKRAVILFTDGVPNRPTDQATGIAQAFAQADRAKNDGIPVYTIGLSSQNPAIGPLQDQVLGDNKNGSGKGIAWRSQNNALYIKVTSAAGLNSAFQKIARSLVVLQ